MGSSSGTEPTETAAKGASFMQRAEESLHAASEGFKGGGLLKKVFNFMSLPQRMAMDGMADILHVGQVDGTLKKAWTLAQGAAKITGGVLGTDLTLHALGLVPGNHPAPTPAATNTPGSQTPAADQQNQGPSHNIITQTVHDYPLLSRILIAALSFMGAKAFMGESNNTVTGNMIAGSIAIMAALVIPEFIGAGEHTNVFGKFDPAPQQPAPQQQPAAAAP